MGLRDLQQMMKNAQKLQEQIEQQLSGMRIEGSSGGGMVKVTVDGRRRILGLAIDPEVIKPEEREMLQDLIIAAINDASAKVEEAVRGQLSGLASGLGIPGL